MLCWFVFHFEIMLFFVIEFSKFLFFFVVIAVITAAIEALVKSIAIIRIRRIILMEVALSCAEFIIFLQFIFFSFWRHICLGETSTKFPIVVNDFHNFWVEHVFLRFKGFRGDSLSDGVGYRCWNGFRECWQLTHTTYSKWTSSTVVLVLCICHRYSIHVLSCLSKDSLVEDRIHLVWSSRHI